MNNISDSILDLLPQFILSIIIVTVFLTAWVITKKVITKVFSNKPIKLKNHVMLFIARTAGVTFWIIALIILFSIWEIDVSSIIAGLGLTGFALGFALKDVLASSVAGILILFHQPFKMKAKISVMGVEGIVIDIDMRYTTIENELGLHLIPNSKLLSEKVTILKELT